MKPGVKMQGPRSVHSVASQRLKIPSPHNWHSSQPEPEGWKLLEKPEVEEEELLLWLVQA